jgi:chorismate synthase
MMSLITQAESRGDTVGGVFTVVAQGVPAGLGSHTQWDLKLDARLAMHLMSIQAIKGVEFGMGFGFGAKKGSLVHDEIFFSADKGFYRKTNNAGGIEGGISNGGEIVVSCAMKPIPSLKKPLRSVNMKTKKADRAEAVRSDVCAVPAAGVIGEAAVAFELAKALREKCGGDSMGETERNFRNYIEQIKGF